MGHCLFIVLLEQTALLHKLQDYEVAFLQLPLFLLTASKTVENCGNCQSLGLIFSVCIIIINSWCCMSVCVCFILESFFFFHFGILTTYVCMERWCFNLNIHLIKSFHTLVVPLLCLEPCAEH